MVIKARTLHDEKWSALNEISLIIPQGFDHLKITEIHYHPLDLENINDRELEFIELKNIGNLSIRLDGLNFFRGINYTFPTETQIAPGEYIVLASNPVEFEKRYGFKPFDEFSGQLANNGETISLQNTTNDTLISIQYDDKYPWPNSADGDGYSLVLREENAYTDLNNAKNWRASKIINGSPGKNENATVVEAPEVFPTVFYLYQNYPNPFNPSTVISWQLSVGSNVELSIYNILGQKIKTLLNKPMPAGYHEVEFNGENLSSGVYLYRIQAGEWQDVKKMVLIK